MIKDIFIDNNIAKNFATPIDPNYKELISWLKEFDQDKIKSNPSLILNYAHLVVSQKLLKEYLDSSKNTNKPNAIPSIIDKLSREGRLIKKSKKEIENFRSNYFSKTILKNLLSNKEDHCHIITILLSERKFCLTYDHNLTYDLENFPKFNVIVKKRPEELDYK